MITSFLCWLIGIACVATPSFGAFVPISVPGGGTGWGNITADTLLTGNGTGKIATTSIGSGLSLSGGVLTATGGAASTFGTTSISATYPLIWNTTSAAMSLGFGTTTSNTWAGTQVFTNTITGSINGNAATVTTNANLTGVVTSVGNATAIADAALSIAKTSGLQTALDLKAPLASPTFTGTVTVPTPTSDTDAATKAYVDATAQGLSIKDSVQVATAAALPTNTYSNGASGVGATLTGVATGVLTVDGVAVALNDRVLVKDEVTAANNGIYSCTVAGAVGVAYVLTRSTNMNQAAEVPGAFTFTENGTVNDAAGFVVADAGPFTIGTTAINWTQFSGAGQIIAGTGISKSGNTLSIDTAVTVDLSTVQSLSNKTFVAPALGTPASGILTNATGLPNAGLLNSTISGVALGGSLFAHTVSGSLTGTSYNGSAAVSDWTLNMANANTWTARQNFANATSTLFSATTGWIDTLNLTNDLTVANGGTGVSTLTGVALGNGASAFSAATVQTCTNQFVRAMSAAYVATCGTVQSEDINLADTFAWTGAHDFGAATDLEIPNGAAPTVNVTGEIALDTTNSQLKVYDGSAVTVHDQRRFLTFSYATSTAWTGTTTLMLGTAPTGITLASVQCYTDVGTLNVHYKYNTGPTFVSSMLNASTTIGTVTFSGNNTPATANAIKVDVGTPATAPTQISCTVTATVTGT